VKIDISPPQPAADSSQPSEERDGSSSDEAEDNASESTKTTSGSRRRSKKRRRAFTRPNRRRSGQSESESKTDMQSQGDESGDEKSDREDAEISESQKNEDSKSTEPGTPAIPPVTPPSNPRRKTGVSEHELASLGLTTELALSFDLESHRPTRLTRKGAPPTSPQLSHGQDPMCQGVASVPSDSNPPTPKLSRSPAPFRPMPNPNAKRKISRKAEAADRFAAALAAEVMMNHARYDTVSLFAKSVELVHINANPNMASPAVAPSPRPKPQQAPRVPLCRFGKKALLDSFVEKQ
jgi:hypothetical protein